jgi:hypothetical protein
MSAQTPFAFDDATHTYLFGERRERVPSVTQIMAGVGLVDYSHIPPAVLAAAAERGTRAHTACEFLLQDDLDWDTLPDDIWGYVKGCEKFLRDTGFKPDPGMIEHQGIHTHNGMHYGYRWDAAGVMNNGNVLLDFKCTASVQPHWGIQTAPYEMAARAIDGKVRRRFVLHLHKAGTYQLIESKDLNDYRIFEWALGIETWKRLNKKGEEHGNECPVDLAV